MKKYLVLFFLIVLLLVLILWINFPSIKKTQVLIPKVIKYRIEVSNPGNSLIENSALLVAIPANLSRHTVSGITVSESYKKVVDEVGNVSVDIDLKSMVPYETKLIDVTVNLNVASKLTKTPENNINKYTKPEKFIESDNRKILQQAINFKADSNLAQAKKTYDWVVGYLSDSGFIEEDRGALYALNHKTADCTGYMYLYGALLRANKIPARMMSGFIVESNKKLNIKDYHNWVEVYLDGVWRVVDPQNKKFLDDESNYIAMRVIDNSKVSLFDNSQQLFKSDGKLNISMK